MAEIISLNKARKAKVKAAKASLAQENRVRFGRTKAERQADSADKTRSETLLDGAKRDAP